LAGLDNDLLFKVTIAGLDPNNEWPWVRSFSQTSLGNTFSTLIGADFAVKEIKVGGLAVKLQLWYVNYCRKFESIRTRHVRGSTGAVILWSDHSSNADAKSLQASIDELQSCNERRLPMIFIRLYDETPSRTCGEDLSSVEVEEIARQNCIPFFSCSVNHPATTVKPLACLTEMILERESAKKTILS
jgi:GTPase SAR1 family protein